MIDIHCFVLRTKGVQEEILYGAKSFLRLKASKTTSLRKNFSEARLCRKAANSENQALLEFSEVIRNCYIVEFQKGHTTIQQFSL